MPSMRRGRVARILRERPGLQRVALSDASAPEPERAYVLTQLLGRVEVGDEVLFNDTAVRLGLGTGGWQVVHANLTRPEVEIPGRGHIMKLRYTSLQCDTGAATEDQPDVSWDLGGVPVVACTLHSQVGVVVAAIAARCPAARVAYVMTDGGALPLALSDLVADLVARRLLVGTVTAGHAFGGDLEAVGVPSALSLARHTLGAEVIVVGMGPGVVGTASALGTTALEAASVLDTTEALGGRPIFCVRASSSDERDRHRGVSHHAHGVLTLARVSADVPVPMELIDTLDEHGCRHRVLPVEIVDPAAVLASFDLSIRTMGRTVAEDPLFFACAVAAGTHASTFASP